MALHKYGVVRQAELVCRLLKGQRSFAIHPSSYEKPGTRPGRFHSLAVTASRAAIDSVTGLAPVCQQALSHRTCWRRMHAWRRSEGFCHYQSCQPSYQP